MSIRSIISCNYLYSFLKRIIIPLLFALALPNKVIARVDPEVHNLCKEVKDYMGCVKAQTSSTENNNYFKSQTSSTEDNKYFQDGLNFLNLSDQYKNEESYDIKKLKKYALKAKSSFDKSLAKFPESKEAHFFRGKSIVNSWYGMVDLNSNDWKTVIRDMNTFIESFPDDPKKGQAYYFIGKSYYTLADDIAAILFFSKALNEGLDNNPSDSIYEYRAYSERGAARFYSDQTELSLDLVIEDLNKAIDQNDRWSGDFYTRGYAKYLKATKFLNGKFIRNFPLLKSALIDLNLAIQKNNPEYIIGDSYQLRGLIKRQLGMDDLGLCKDDNSGCLQGCKDISKGVELGGRLTQSAYGAPIARMGCDF